MAGVSGGVGVSTFSERFGFASPTGDLKPEQMPDGLRNGLWQACIETFFEKTHYFVDYGEAYDADFKHYAKLIFADFFRKSTDQMPSRAESVLGAIRKWYFDAKFYEVYDFLEFLAAFGNPAGRDKQRPFSVGLFASLCNKVLARERAAFRFSGAVLVMITNEEELAEIGRSLSENPAAAVREHIKRATEMYSDRVAPDFRNSVKESISAVEAAVRFVTWQRPSPLPQRHASTPHQPGRPSVPASACLPRGRRYRCPPLALRAFAADKRPLDACPGAAHPRQALACRHACPHVARTVGARAGGNVHWTFP
jgi:hypothetical protein